MTQEELTKQLELPYEKQPLWLFLFERYEGYTLFAKTDISNKLTEIKAKIYARNFWEERIEIINKEVKEARAWVEQPFVTSLLGLLNKHYLQLQEENAAFEGAKGYYKGIDFKKHITVPVIGKYFDAVINSSDPEIVFTGDDFKEFLEEFKKVSEELASYLTHTDLEKGIGMMIVDVKMKELYLSNLLTLQREVAETYPGKVPKDTKADKTPNETDTGKEPTGKKKPVKKHGPEAITEVRQVLTIYFTLKQLGLEEQFVYKTDIAKLVHLFAGIEFPCDENGNINMDNSQIYQSVKKAFKKDTKRYIKDIEFVKSIFSPIATDDANQLKDIVETLQKEIAGSKR
ncbi:MAG TPA: hypothetical protein VEC12_10530 [Bacteroidia bacterium]|nr:hypothetical protein [Bacteroidia bacterium]